MTAPPGYESPQAYQQLVQGQQPQGQPMSLVYVSSKGVWTARLCFRIFSVLSCIVLYGLAIAALYGSDPSVMPLIMIGSPAGVALIWSFVDCVMLCASRGHRGIHPGACVGVDLILWLGYAASMAIFCTFAPTSEDGYYQYPGGALYPATVAFTCIEM
ncbi:hypothetical protein ACJ41O_004751 [Fusarium nematophilum]